MTAETKTVNYTAEQTAEMKEAYTATPTEETVRALAEKFGKTTKSVIAKLAKEGVYRTKGKEAGKRAMLKAEMVTEIATLLGKEEETLDSLEKATGQALMAVLVGLRAKHEASAAEV